MGIFSLCSKIKKAVVGFFGHRPGEKTKEGVTERRDGKLRFNPLSMHRVRFRPNTGRSIFGPIFTPVRDFHHVSRPAARHFLRGLFFAQFSKEYPSASRRQRRRVSRLAAGAEYRTMMQDPTNLNTNVDGANA